MGVPWVFLTAVCHVGFIAKYVEEGSGLVPPVLSGWDWAILLR